MNTVLVIGADRGIAESLCRRLRARGDRVLATCLAEQPALSALGVEVIAPVDVTCDADVARLAARLDAGGVRLDALLHVAGVLGLDQLGAIDFDDMRRQFEINALGPLRVVQALLGRLPAGAKVAIVTSRVGSLGDNGSGGMYAYRASKAAANMIGLNLHHDLKARGVHVVLLHPGAVATALTRDFPQQGMTSPDEAADALLRRVDDLDATGAGRFLHASGMVLPW